MAADTPLGDRSLLLINPNGDRGSSVYGLLEVVPSGTLARRSPAMTAARSPQTEILPGKTRQLPLRTLEKY